MNQGPARGVAYARFSSDMQREESIDAQLRAIHDYAKRENIVIIDEYIDRAHSATTDQRPAFQQMIADAKQGAFDFVIVHKLDRFSRNRYDSAVYRRALKMSGVRLRSVLENLDDSPESVLLESLLEGMNEYYSKNLAREVQKGLKENALHGKHVGGVPPLGYKVNPETLRLEEEPFEAEAVKMIFKMYLDGSGYGEIISALNRGGYRTRRGNLFGKNSLYEILRNEKYTGTYVYNKSAPRDAQGKVNRHRARDEEDIIRVENAMPRLVSKEDFDKVQEKMAQRRHRTAQFKAKQVYLMSGRVICGCCGSAYVGNSRRPRPDHPHYVSYRCAKHNGSVECHNPEIRAETLERAVLHVLANYLFDEKLLPELQRQYADFAASQDEEALRELEALKKQEMLLQTGIDNIVSVMVKTGSAALAEKLNEMETQHACVQAQIQQKQQILEVDSPSMEVMQSAFSQAKAMLCSGELNCVRHVIEEYVGSVVIWPETVEIVLHIGMYTQSVSLRRKNLLGA